MALIEIPGGLWIPQVLPDHHVSGDNDTDINASGEKIAQIVTIPKDGTLETVAFSLRAWTQCTNGIRVSFQNLNASGQPDETQDEYRDITVGATGWFETGIISDDGTDVGTKRTVSAGDKIAIVFEFVTFDTGDAVGFRRSNNNPDNVSSPPYVYNKLPTWSQADYSYRIALKYDDGTYAVFGNYIYPIDAAPTTTNFNNTSTPDERALAFTVPVQVKCGGAWVLIDPDNACDVVLYDGDGSTVLGSESLGDGARVGGVIASAYVRWAPVILKPGTTYRLSMKPTSASNIGGYHFTVDSNALFACCEGGTSWVLSTQTDAGGWSETNTARPFAGLLLTHISDGHEAGYLMGVM